MNSVDSLLTSSSMGSLLEFITNSMDSLLTSMGTVYRCSLLTLWTVY